MKLERLPEYVTTFVVLLVGISLAILCGSMTGGGQFKVIAAIFALVLVATVCITLKTKVWLLLPLCWGLTGQIPVSNVPLAVRDIAVIVVVLSFLIFYALKLVRVKPKFELLDTIIVLNLVNLVVVFFRNPVGVSFLGSQMVGGRPYFDIAIAFLAYAVMCRAPVDLQTARRMPFMLLVGSAFVSLGSLITILRPSTADKLGLIYSSFAPQQFQPGVVVDEDTIGRKPLLGTVGETGMRLLCSYFSPITFFSPLHLLRFTGAAAFIVAILFSGFRSALLGVFASICLSSYFRRRIHDIVLFAILGGALLSIVALGNGRIFNLPLSVQRAFSFLPGDWDYEAAKDAEGSTEWRHQIWRMALTEDRWIRNKWLGDGFGFTARDLELMNSTTGFSGVTSQELFLTVGNYHSGPISTIRYAGLLGLVLFVPLSGLLVIRAVRLIRTCEKTALFPIALFVGMPIIYFPLPFIFVAGSFDGGMEELLFGAGLIRVLERVLAQMSPAPPLAAVAELAVNHPDKGQHLQAPAGIY